MPSTRPKLLGVPWTLLTFVLYLSVPLHAEVLTPKYINIATNKKVTASSTCGEDGPELYCKLVGANADTDENINSHFVIKGQVCDVCDPNKEGKAHPPEHATDGSDRWWQSPPLSRGMTYNEVNLTIDLGQEFHVAYVFITMANSPRPGVWVLERSIDNGETYRPWQYFADSPAECERFFGVDGDEPIVSDDFVVCSTQFSKVVPLEGGEIVVQLLRNRPGASDFFSSTALQEWTRATNVRLRLLRTKTLLGHLMSVARQDHTVTRRYFYSIKDISIGGRCRCNGHAESCIPDTRDDTIMLCECQHNTYGPQCEQCHPQFVQKAWRPASNSTPFICERCNCFGHSQECLYDEETDKKGLSLDLQGQYSGGGVCQNCQHNTQGINCHTCKPGFYRPYDVPLDAQDVCEPCRCGNFAYTGNCEEGSGRCECRAEFLPPNCDECNVGYYGYPDCKPCDCNRNGTEGQICEVGGGQCPCKSNFAGVNCDKCAEGYYNFPECLPCECDTTGSASSVCDTTTGDCECANNYGGRTCSVCADGYYQFPDCNYCQCDKHGTREGICNKNDGSCLCREGYGGIRCDQCLPGYYGHPDCRFCNCSAVGSATTICDASGKCPCLQNFSGRTCDQCTPGFYKFPECLACECDTEGSMGVSCDDEGKCHCKPNFDGLRCSECREGFYIYPYCEECNCDPSGVIESFSGCGNAPQGELCQCKSRVQGRICNSCKPLFWNLQQNNPEGCEDCDCYIPGVLGGIGVCESKSGQCPCKNQVVSRRCEKCRDGYFNLTDSNLLGCQDCNCDPGGSASDYCDEFGQCDCRPRVTGRSCDAPLTTHYFPTLHQLQTEAEDGVTVSGGPVRFGYNESLFPGYSWRGYAVYSQLQPQTIHRVEVMKSSLYRVVMRYVNPADSTVVGEFVASPDNPNEAEMKYKVKFEPTGLSGTFLTILQAGNIPAPFVLNPGRWYFSIKSESPLFVDYFVLLPEAYYEASILQKRVSDPCSFNITNQRRGKVQFVPDPCVLMKYPSLQKFDRILGAATDANTKSYLNKDSSPPPNPAGEDQTTLQLLSEELAFLSPEQTEMELDLPITKSGRYALVMEYFTPEEGPPAKISMETTSKKGMAKGSALLHSCLHATPCRQVMTTDSGEVAVFRFDNNLIKVKLEAADDITSEVVLVSLSAIPMGKWSLDYIRPQDYCVINNGTCTMSSYDLPPDSMKVEAESVSPDRILPTEELPEGVTDKSVVQLSSNDRMISIPGKVNNPGYYIFVVHYFQAENPDFTMDVVIKNGHHQEGRVPILHCPSIAGCRSIVVQDDTNNRFYLDGDYELTLKSPKDVLIDYVLVAPYTDQSARELDNYLQLAPMDETRRFIAECGKNHMYLPSNASEFCRKSAFSLTTEYNNGAQSCQCAANGTLRFECEPFGGQCPCKDNVIGRRCERCKTGFFGYPDCEACNCPSTALCDPDTGKCICPPRVTGKQCDKCEDLTYGFDPLIGCEECACNPLGVERGDLQCDVITGKCNCKPNIVGRACNNCLAGYWAFPYCQLCQCEIQGTTDTICNEETAECYCKPNVEGRRCETCKLGSFNLDQENPNGCTKCFCFGKTSSCTSSSQQWAQMSAPGRSAISSVVIDVSQNIIIREVDLNSEEVEEDSEDANLITLPEDKLIAANDSYIQFIRIEFHSNHLASYGGHLHSRIELEPDYSEDAPRTMDFKGAPAIILEGRELSPSSNNIYFMHYLENDVSDNTSIVLDVQLIEEKFRVQSMSRGIVPPTRDQMMILLKELKAIYVRTTYWQKTRKASLAEFSLDIAVAVDDPYNRGRQASSVEQCHCPPNYKGYSCEECADGYYRSPNGPFGGFCIPCQCNGHSDTCDPVSGVCKNCQHSTAGDHCEKCDVGYHGDATQGTPMDCLICACPLPYPSNNFATSCELSANDLEISCECRPGYTGLRCQSCGPGFYGRPEVLGDYCKPCECSGNIDVTNPESCDTVTGRCLLCLNHTGGPACAQCAPWHYGDPIEAKYCEPCPCDQCGTSECLQESGQCNCLENVEGSLCNRCAPDHYGLSICDGRGCRACECAPASETTSCEDATGQCKCKPGTTGRTCDRCAPGYWNYSEDGCIPCQCNSEYAIGVTCDPATGQCSCLPGVIGDKCDRCPDRWVLIEGRGCQVCESCHHQLLDSTDEMLATLQPVKSEFQSVAAGYFTTQKLTYFNDTAARLEPEVQMLDPSRVNLGPYYNQIDSSIQEHKSAKQRAEVHSDSLKDKARASAKIRKKTKDMETTVMAAVDKTQKAVYETQSLMESLLSDAKFTTPQTESALTEAKQTLDTMMQVSLSADDAMEEKKSAEKLLREINEYVAPVKKITAKIKSDQTKIGTIREKLKDLRNESDYSRQVSLKANEIIKQIKADKYPSKVTLLEDKVDQTQSNRDKAVDVNTKTKPILDDLENALNGLNGLIGRVDELSKPLEESVANLQAELESNADTIKKSQDHVKKLEREADGLNALLNETIKTSESSVNAATAYKKIVDAIEEAKSEAAKAKENAETAATLISEVQIKARGAVEPSSNLLTTARSKATAVEQELKIPLDDAKIDMNEIEKIKNETEAALMNIEKELDKVSSPRSSTDIDNTIEVSGEAIFNAEEAIKSVEDLLSKIPEEALKARQLPVTINDLNRGVQLSDGRLKLATESVPLSQAIAGNLSEKKPETDGNKEALKTKLNDLKSKILTAREQANRIPVGMHFDKSSALRLANPPSIENQQYQSKFSFYFKTQDPDGLLLFIGNEPGKRETDFMAVEVNRGYPTLTMDLGSGKQTIRNDKFVSDNVWYKASVDRTGKSVQFTISEEDQSKTVKDYPSEGYITGPKSLFNVHKNSSRIYVGGLPESYSDTPVRYSSYVGVIEDVRIGEEKVGLWNFKDAQNISPAMEKNKFVDLKTQTGLRFLGKGYAKLDKRQLQFKEKSAIRFTFKTRAANGILFLVNKDDNFLSIEMVNGRVVYQHNLGTGIVRIATPQTYNDGQWHQVDAVRDRKTAVLSVDTSRDRKDSPGENDQLVVSDAMYFGGYPTRHDYPEVTQTGFEGCIDNVLVHETAIDLTKALETRNTSTGCPSLQFNQAVVNFYGSGYLQVPLRDDLMEAPFVAQEDEVFELNFRLRTNSSQGLIFYGANSDQSTELILRLNNGALQVVAEPENVELKTDKLNDGEWHVVTVTKTANALSVNIDDKADYKETIRGAPLYLSGQGSLVFFGGAKDDMASKKGVVLSSLGLKGCIGDINLNRKRLDFAKSMISKSKVSHTCLVGEGAGVPEIEEPEVLPEEKEPTKPMPDTSKEDEVEPEESVTAKPPRSKPPPPKPYEKCALPFRELETEPADQEISMEEGVRFGKFKKTSRLEFSTTDDDRSRSEYSIEFKTANPDGVIFFRSDFVKADYVALFMRRGILHFGFDSGSGPAILNSTKMLNDSKWHSVQFSRFKTDGVLNIDSEIVATGQSPGSTNDINAGPILYIGGLPNEAWSKKLTTKKLLSIDSAFRGCLRNFFIRGKSPGQPKRIESVEPCTDDVEPGYFFYPKAGFLKLSDNFQVGQKIHISLKIKPRYTSGVILAVHGSTDYMVLQMINGTVKFTVNNGDGPFSSSFSKGEYDLCDGKWHSIYATKTKNVVTLAIDQQHSQVGMGKLKSLTTNTNNPIYLGGLPNTQLPGVETADQFVGCLKDFVLEKSQGKKKPFKVTYESMEGTVALHSCPAD